MVQAIMRIMGEAADEASLARHSPPAVWPGS